VKWDFENDFIVSNNSDFLVLLFCFSPAGLGVAVGAGVQSMVAFVNLGSYYIIGLPAGILLGYVVHLEVQVSMTYTHYQAH
jgi:MATE family multidrug resistance protein